MKKDYIYLTLIYIVAVFLILYFGNRFFVTGTEPGPSLYKTYADYVFSGNLPYRDFLFEYPPMTLVFIILPRVFSASFDIYQMFFWLQIGIFGLLGLWMIIDSVRNLSKLQQCTIAILYILLLLSLGIINFSRYDLIPAVMTLAAVYLKTKNKHFWAYFILALAVMTKIYPLVILPLFLIDDLKKPKLMLTGFVAFVFGIILPLLPFLKHLNDLKVFIIYHGQRGIQLESLWANFLMIKHLLTGSELNLVSEAGALGLKPYPNYFINLSYFLLVASLGLTYWFYRHKKDLFIFSFLSILIFIIFNRVFSPQYFAWILVFFPFLVRQNIQSAILSIGFLIAALITKKIYPELYVSDQLLGFKTKAIILLSARNFILVAILINVFLNQILSKKQEDKLLNP